MHRRYRDGEGYASDGYFRHQYKDKTFDYMIMNHFLEHIEDTPRAVLEVKRALKLEGKLTISFPVCIDQNTLEFPDVKTPKERLSDMDRKTVCGFLVMIIEEVILVLRSKCLYLHERLTENEIERYGFIEDDVLMECASNKHCLIHKGKCIEKSPSE